MSLLIPNTRQTANMQQAKLKVQLKLSISRLRMVQQKDSAKAKQQRREMAQLLEVHDCRSRSTREDA
jgi:ribosome-binding protein aMBF1 (putative translation factor)